MAEEIIDLTGDEPRIIRVEPITPPSYCKGCSCLGCPWPGCCFRNSRAPVDKSTQSDQISVEPNWGDCPVCEKPLSNGEMFSTKCGHVFCKQCIKFFIRLCERCPECRKKVTFKQIHPIYLD